MTRPYVSKMDSIVERLTGLSIDASAKASLEVAANAVAEHAHTVRTESLDRKAASVNDLVGASGVLSGPAITQEAIQRRLAADAAERMKLEAAALTGADKNNGVCVTIPIPSKFASRFPDPVKHNKGYPPHMTVLYVAEEMGMGDASGVLHTIRKACKATPPFRVFVDANGGLKDFGPTDSGQKALWLEARSDPDSDIGKLHRLLRIVLEREGVEIHHHNSFHPHVTWSYVENDISEKERNRLEGHVANRFQDGFWFDVRHLAVDMPDGSVKVVSLSPIPRKSVY